jgi:hypothetical protein
MPCPNIANDEISMLKTARERTGAGYTSNFYIAPPIYMSDIQRLSGGNSSGSGRSYPPVALANPINNRPDGANPLQMSEFSLYDQNPPRTAFMFNYDNQSSNNACAFAIPFDTYYHDDANNLVPSNVNIYTAYTTQTGTTVATAGYYAIYTTGGSPSGSWMQVGNNGLIIATGSC